MKKMIVIVFIGIASMFFFSKGQAQMLFMENELTGKLAPEFTLEKISGENQSLSDFRDGKNTIVIFWATWCPYCREQLTIMNKRIEELSQQEIKIAAVNLGETSDIINNFIQENNLKLEVFIDEKSSLEELYSVISLPKLVFINKEGNVKAVKHSLPSDVEKLFNFNSLPTQ